MRISCHLGLRMLDSNDDNFVEFNLGGAEVHFSEKILPLSLWALVEK